MPIKFYTTDINGNRVEIDPRNRTKTKTVSPK